MPAITTRFRKPFTNTTRTATSSAPPTAKASPASTTTETANSSPSTNGRCRPRRKRPKQFARNRLARCAVRHAVPARYRSIRYHYDFNGNRTATVLPDGRQINYLYYGSGHLHQISLDDEVISDIERDKLHREIFRTQGKLASRYELDPLGRLKRQIATLNDLTEGGKGKTKVTSAYAVKRGYGYDRTGNLTHSTDQRTGTTHFEYDKLGRITQAGNELFAFDPAHNILDIPTEKVKPYPAPSPVGEGRGEGKTTAPLSDDRSVITDNRLKTYNGTTYYYDDLGNLIHRRTGRRRSAELFLRPARPTG